MPTHYDEFFVAKCIQLLNTAINCFNSNYIERLKELYKLFFAQTVTDQSNSLVDTLVKSKHLTISIHQPKSTFVARKLSREGVHLKTQFAKQLKSALTQFLSNVCYGASKY